MPGIVAHKVLALKLLDRISVNDKKLIMENYSAYLLGTLGPDFFYFYKPLAKMPLTKKADNLHELTLFELLNKVETNNISDYFRAYLYGLYTHFILDYNVHKYINRIEGETLHLKLESSLESMLIDEYFMKVRLNKLNRFIKIDNRLIYELATIYDEKPKVIKKALKDMHFLIGKGYSTNKISNFMTKLVLKISRNYKTAEDMLIKLEYNHNDHKLLELYDIWFNSIYDVSDYFLSFKEYLQTKEEKEPQFSATFAGYFIKRK